MAVAVHGHAALEGETAFAFFVVRTREPIARGRIVDLLHYLAPLIPDPDTFVEELSEDIDQAVQILALPWLPPEAGHAVSAQRRLIESAAAHGIDAAWFFQTGTSLPDLDDDDDDEDDGEDLEYDDDADEGDPRSARAMTTDDSWAGESSWSMETGWSSGEVSGETRTTPIEIIDISTPDDELDDLAAGADEAAEGGAEGEPTWSHGPPPQVTRPRFPVDGYPAILDEDRCEDLGIAVKLRGDMLAGEGTVLFAFHTLWLAPYGGRLRNAEVMIDRTHHAAHFWVDRFAPPCSVEQQVHHLLWILSKLDQVVPILHARFAGATTMQKYAGLADEENEPFVLGGNPLLAVHAEAGEEGVDRWIAAQTEWSPQEIGQMLRELAIDVVTASGEDDGDEAEATGDEERGRYLAAYAGELLAARAAAGMLDPRVPRCLEPLLALPDDDPRRPVAARVVAANDRAARDGISDDEDMN